MTPEYVADMAGKIYHALLERNYGTAQSKTIELMEAALAERDREQDAGR